MGDQTKIEWADASWPIVTGCTHISEGCDHCYAATLTSTRLRHLPEYAGLAENGRFNGTVRCLEDRLDWPLRWRKPRKVFVCDMADLFHQGVPDKFIARVFAVMAECPQHTFQVLTKRHSRMRSLLSSVKFEWDVFDRQTPGVRTRLGPAEGWPLPNVWLGVSAEDQHWANIRIPALVDTPAAVRFVSAEPLLGPVDLSPWLGTEHECRGVEMPPGSSPARGHTVDCCTGPALDWVIAGGESGPGARPCELAWIEDIVNQCHAAEVPVFVKQFGKVLGAEFGAGPKGGNIDRWPAYLQHRHFPRVAEAVPA